MEVVSKDSTLHMRKGTVYPGIDGLRTFAAIGIVLMHIKSNVNYQIDGVLLNTIIDNFAPLVSLFFIISGFSMCCGYYESIKSGSISLNEFYKKRYMRSLPVFAILVLIEVLYGGLGKQSIFEGIADVTLVFSFLPKSDISVVGVGWTLGIIFAFYILFPFYVFLIWNKRRAFASLFLSLFFTYACETFFLLNGQIATHNILLWMSFFVSGGIIYLYKDKITSWINKRYVIYLFITIFILVIRYIQPSLFGMEFDMFYRLLGDCALLILAISCKSVIKMILVNPITKFISSISLEIYLAHMFVFRFVDKMHLTQISPYNYISYGFTCILTLAGVIVFALVIKRLFSYIAHRISRANTKKKND